MTREHFTPTPNILFDQFLKKLSSSELKILLVIIRQTNGWIDKKTGKRKERDRITHNQFITKTGLSRRIISGAIKSLSQKQLVKITDCSGDSLCNPYERKGQYRIYYSSVLDINKLPHNLNQTSVKSDIDLCNFQHQHVQKVIHNKRNSNKRNLSKERQSDYVHIGEVIDKIRLRWNPK